jgi:hypothetical protein
MLVPARVDLPSDGLAIAGVNGAGSRADVGYRSAGTTSVYCLVPHGQHVSLGHRSAVVHL